MNGAPAERVCMECGDAVDWCAFRDETDCPKAICYGCLTLAVGQAAAQPHHHGD